jgi:pimeloyl-ACP methyl ester carboxylesterase
MEYSVTANNFSRKDADVTTPPLVLVHGYSDVGQSWDRWIAALIQRGVPPARLRVANYVSKTNEVTIKDIARGFERALQRAGVRPDEPFDAVVHSTGMLVLRSWLTTYPEHRDRLNHLIGLAPATFGSPLAHKGRSWIGALFKGSHEIGPDFLEAGDLILDGLELGSRFTWDLAHCDIVGDTTYYGPDSSTPYAFVFIGNEGYSGIRQALSEPGTDGTVRWSGCSLNSRKLTIDLTERPATRQRYSVGTVRNITHMPVFFVNGVNHGSILRDPPAPLVELVYRALGIESAEELTLWTKDAETLSGKAEPEAKYQQFVIRALDDRGDPVHDYNIQICGLAGEHLETLENFDVDVHTYTSDSSFRCFHVDLTAAEQRYERFRVRVFASTGTDRVGYLGFSDTRAAGQTMATPELTAEIEVDVPFVLKEKTGADDAEIRLFYPFTTTLVELRFSREPLPLNEDNQVFWFLRALPAIE